MEEEGYEIIMPFLDESESFTHGFECGQVWEQMKLGQTISRMIHLKNTDQIKMIAEANNYDFTTYYHLPNDEWAQLQASPKEITVHQAPKNI